MTLFHTTGWHIECSCACIQIHSKPDRRSPRTQRSQLRYSPEWALDCWHPEPCPGKSFLSVPEHATVRIRIALILYTIKQRHEPTCMPCATHFSIRNLWMNIDAKTDIFCTMSWSIISKELRHIEKFSLAQSGGYPPRSHVNLGT